MTLQSVDCERERDGEAAPDPRRIFAALSMPEMVDGENCLLGETATEIADIVAAVARDTALRRRLAEAGYATFVDKFTARPVVDEIFGHLQVK